MNQTNSLSARLDRCRRWALIAGIAGLILALLGAFLNREQFFQSYLFGYVFWVGLSLGCFALMLLHYLARGSWGFAIQRPLESGARTLLLMALLFIPIALGIPVLYVWSRPEAVSGDELLQHKSLYLNVPFFLIRTAIYFVIWIGITLILTRRADEESGQRVPSLAGEERMGRVAELWLTRRVQRISALSLVAFGLTVTFALIDWVMSLEPQWYSTIYSAMVAMEGVLSSFAFVVIVVIVLADYEPLSKLMNPQLLNDLGSLSLAFVMLWAYMAFSQFMLIWIANLQDEIPWYLRRLGGGWQWVALILALFHFALPFALLILRDVKRDARKLIWVALLLLVTAYIDAFWLVTPAFHPAALQVHWLDLATSIGIGGLWVTVFIWQLKGRSLVPSYAPQLNPSEHGKAAEDGHAAAPL